MTKCTCLNAYSDGCESHHWSRSFPKNYAAMRKLEEIALTRPQQRSETLQVAHDYAENWHSSNCSICATTGHNVNEEPNEKGETKPMSQTFNNYDDFDTIVAGSDGMRDTRDATRRRAQRLIDRAKLFRIEADRCVSQARLIEAEINEQTAITPDE